MREKLKTYIIQLFFIIVLLVTLFIGIFNTEAQAYAISAVLSFIHDGDYPLSAEPSAYFYEELVNTASYLCAQRGQHFFYERDVIINSTLDVVINSVPGNTSEERVWNPRTGAATGDYEQCGETIDMTKLASSIEVLELRNAGVASVKISAESISYAGENYITFSENAEGTADQEAINIRELTVYTTGRTFYTFVAKYMPVNNQLAYILAECANNAGIKPAASYVNVAFWSLQHSQPAVGNVGTAENVAVTGNVGAVESVDEIDVLSAAELSVASTSLPAQNQKEIENLEAYIKRINNGKKLTDNQINKILDIIDRLNINVDSYRKIVNQYKANPNSTARQRAIKELMETLIEKVKEDGEKKNNGNETASELIQDAETFNDMWNEIGNSYGDKIENQTNLSAVKVEYNSGTKQYTIGPFKMSYIERYTSTNQLAGMTGDAKLEVRENGQTVVLPRSSGQWDFVFTSNRPSGIPSAFNSFPHSGETFYIRLNFKEGREKVTGLKLEFRYITARAEYSIFEGNIEKLAWTYKAMTYIDGIRQSCYDYEFCNGANIEVMPYVYDKQKHDSPQKHYHNYECDYRYCEGTTSEDIPCNLGKYHSESYGLGPKGHSFPCPGHYCDGSGHKCPHGSWYMHYWQFGYKVKWEPSGEVIDIQDIAGVNYAWRRYTPYTWQVSISGGSSGSSTSGGSGSWSQAWDIDLTTTLAGNVWVDQDPQKNNGVKNGLADGSEQLLKNVAVTVKLYDQGGNFVRNAIFHDSAGNQLNWPIYTNGSGYYEVNRIEAPGTNGASNLFYVVEFEYDGQVLKNSVYLGDPNNYTNNILSQSKPSAYKSNPNLYANSSMAVEEIHDRYVFDQTFGEITGNSSVNSNNNTTGITRTTDENGKNATTNSDQKYNTITYSGTSGKLGKTGSDRISSTLDSPMTDNDAPAKVTNMDLAATKDEYERYRMKATTYYNNTDLHGKNINKDDFRIQYPIEGSTYVLNANVSGNKRFISEYMLHINLGLVGRATSDISVMKELQKVTLVVNEQKVTREFNTAGVSDYDDFLIQVEHNRANGNYTLGLYASDVGYQSDNRYGNAIQKVLDIKDHTELRVFATYVVRIDNNSDTNDVEINEITDYFDETYTLVNKGGDVYTSIVNEDLKRENSLIAEAPYYRIVDKNNSTISTTWKATRAENIDGYAKQGDFEWNIQGNKAGMVYSTSNILTDIKLQNSEYVEIFTTYEIDKDGYEIMDAGGINATAAARAELLGEKYNIAEVSNYSTYYTDKDYDDGFYNAYKPGWVSGRVDRDSAPNNIDLNNIKNRNRYEDDTDCATPLSVKMEEYEREMYGYVWEDNKAEDLGKYNLKVGNGYYEVGETLIPNVEVSLYEVINLSEVNSNGDYEGTYDSLEYYYKVPTEFYSSTGKTEANKVPDVDGNLIEGNYYIYGFLAGDYILRYDYGTQTDATADINYDGTENAIIKYNGQDYENTRFMGESTERFLNTKYLDMSGDTEINGIAINDLPTSKARDNESRRMYVVAYSRNIENDRGEILRDRDASNQEYVDSTRMFAETPIMQIEIDDPRTLETYQSPNGTTSDLEKIEPSEYQVNTNRYTIDNINFGLEKRAKTDIALEKYVDQIFLLKNEEIILKVAFNEDGTVIKDDVDAKGLDQLTPFGHSEATRGGLCQQGFYAIAVEDEFLNGLSLMISYKMKVINNSEVDFTGRLAGYYLAEDIKEMADGTPTDSIYKLTIRELEKLDEEGIGISSNSTLAKVIDTYQNKPLISSLLQQGALSGTPDPTDTLRPELIIYGRYVGRYYYQNEINEEEYIDTVANYSKDTTLEDVEVTYGADKVVKTIVDQMIDYIDVNTNLDKDMCTFVENYSWLEVDKAVEADGKVTALDKLISDFSYRKVDEKLGLYDEKNRTLVRDTGTNIAVSYNENIIRDDTNNNRVRYNKLTSTSLYNTDLSRELKPVNYTGDSNSKDSVASVYIVTRKNASQGTDANEMKMDNVAEVLVYSNPTGRRDVNSVPGNALVRLNQNTTFWELGYNSIGKSKPAGITDEAWEEEQLNWTKYPENDAWSPEYVTITAPTGIALRTFIQNNLVQMIGLVIALIGLGSMFIIKQMKIKKNNRDIED